MRRSLSSNIILFVALVALASMILLPMWQVISSSIKIPSEIIGTSPSYFPHSFTLQHFRKLLESSDFPVYFANSLIVSGISAFVNTLFATLAGYAFFRLRFPGREFIYKLVMMAYAFPSIVILIPIYLMFAKLGLIDSRLSLILVNVTFALPFSIWMMRSFFSALPHELEEAALLDGATLMQTARYVLIPLMKPGLASIAIFSFVSSWTEYLFASVLILSDNKRTIPVGLSGIIGQYQIDWGLMLAGATLTILPVVLIFAFVGRWFVAGLTEGSVK